VPHKILTVLVDSVRVRLVAMGKVLCIMGGRINAWIKAGELMIMLKKVDVLKKKFERDTTHVLMSSHPVTQ